MLQSALVSVALFAHFAATVLWYSLASPLLIPAQFINPKVFFSFARALAYHHDLDIPQNLRYLGSGPIIARYLRGSRDGRGLHRRKGQR
jgi:hypothetical protein